MKSIHKIQLEILQKLLFSKSLRHSQLKPNADIPNSQLKFHLDELINDNLIEKKEAKYFLTESGKEFANRIKTENTTIVRQAKLSCVMCCVKNNNSEIEYLIYKRLKNPFFGCQGFPTEKAEYGESIDEAAKRGLKEETNLSSTPELFGIRHFRVYNLEKELLEDKVMYLFKFENPEGELLGNIEGEFNWIKEKELEQYITNPLEEFNEIYELLKSFNGNLTFKEIEQYTNKF